ncbi:cortexin domain-containing 1 isoform X2 [Bos indicus x Bos taurus]|uniref:cortexin domain-containing 1 isoform X2 n=1 Tax=Bos indicus x Bos taurus TaxID=30522 RepID=UPI000F7D230F|nr:cortexin domain-containing 1 isoform X2 [Bos indicus x Bos taurus]
MGKAKASVVTGPGWSWRDVTGQHCSSLEVCRPWGALQAMGSSATSPPWDQQPLYRQPRQDTQQSQGQGKENDTPPRWPHCTWFSRCIYGGSTVGLSSSLQILICSGEGDALPEPQEGRAGLLDHRLTGSQMWCLHNHNQEILGPGPPWWSSG